MNDSKYIFGNFDNGFTQFPDDYTRKIFQNFYAKSTAPTQITIHRQNDLMYYGYLRKLDDVQCIGFCVVINGELLTRVDKLFPIFENAIESLVLGNEIIGFSEKGDVVTLVNSLNDKPIEVNKVFSIIEKNVSRLQDYLRKLPVKDLVVENNSEKIFNYKKFDNNEVVEASAKCDTFIHKGEDYDSAKLIIRQMEIKKEYLEKKKLEEEREKEEREREEREKEEREKEEREKEEREKEEREKEEREKGKSRMFRWAFSFRGRIRRAEYWITLIMIVAVFQLSQKGMSYLEDSGVVDVWMNDPDLAEWVIPIFRFIVILILCWFLLAQGTKRCHDIGHSGWVQIIPLYVVRLLFVDGMEGENEYGSSPK